MTSQAAAFLLDTYWQWFQICDESYHADRAKHVVPTAKIVTARQDALADLREYQTMYEQAVGQTFDWPIQAVQHARDNYTAA